MFAPSFITGSLISRFGVLRIMTAGALLFAAALAVNLSGTDVPRFWLGLVLVGVAWNFLYIGGTALLTQTYRPAEKATVQAANDFLVFGSVALCALSSGALHDRHGWEALNLVLLPFVGVTLLALLWLQFRPRRPATA